MCLCIASRNTMVFVTLEMLCMRVSSSTLLFRVLFGRFQVYEQISLSYTISYVYIDKYTVNPASSQSHLITAMTRNRLTPRLATQHALLYTSGMTA